MEDVDSEKQKPLPCHFHTPCLQLTKDESKARIHWQAKGNSVAKDYIPKQLARKVARPRLEHLMDPEDYGDVVVSDLFLCSPDANEGLASFPGQLPISALAKQFPGMHPLDWSLGFCQWQHVSKEAACTVHSYGVDTTGACD